MLACAATGAGAAPSTFGPVIGSALLCRSQLDNAYFHAYLTEVFGPAYKREGGAYWFRTEASLWRLIRARLPRLMRPAAY